MIRLTRAQVRQVDQRSMEEYGIPGIVLMENAARGAADVAMNMLRAVGDKPRAAVLIVCGPGNNGGDGLAIARHLHNRGARVQLMLCVDPGKYSGDALTNWRIVQKMRLPVIDHIDKAPALVIDAIFGTGLTRPAEGAFARTIETINQLGAPVLAIDIPSGMDCDTGKPLGACVGATKTVTFVAEKAGFADPESRQRTGEVIVADIGCPPELIEDVLRCSG